MCKFTKIISALLTAAMAAMCFSSCQADGTAAETEVSGANTEALSRLTETRIDASAVDDEAASYEDGILTISEEGNYVISGQNDNLRIVIDAAEDAVVQLTLDNAALSSSDGSVIYAANAEAVYISAEAGTENTLSDCESYSGDDTDACIYSKADLYFIGSGVITVNGSYKHGIVSKNTLTIEDCSLNVSSVKTGIDGKDGVTAFNAVITVTSGTNGIRSSNSDSDEQGNITIDECTVTISSDGDCIDAENTLEINGGTLELTSGGGYENGSSGGGNFSDFSPRGGMQMNMGGFPPEAPESTADTSSDENAANPPDMADFGGAPPQGGGNFGFGGFDDYYDGSSEEASAKGLKAGKLIKITGGEFTINSSDDAIHSNGSITLSGGVFSIKSGDDGIHADENVNISDVTLSVDESYEGIEGKHIVIDSGKISISSSDDGINAADPNSTVTDIFAAQDGVLLEINGGEIVVSASGDGIDSNGEALFTAGSVYISGPESSDNGSLDVNGEATITGGTFIYAGSSGMAEGFSSSSTSIYKLYRLSKKASAGEKIAIADADGNIIIEFTPDKSFQCILFSAQELESGETVTLTVGDTSTEITL